MISRIGAKRRRSSFCPGFTLLELILVILLISILIALSTPAFRGTFSELQLKNTSFNISKIIDYSQEMAIIERENYKLNFDFREGKYWLTKRDASEGKAVYKRIGGRHGRIFSLPQGLAMSGEKDAIIFYPDGRSDGIEMTIVDRTGRGRLLRVGGFGSKVEIEEVGYE